MLNTVTNIMRNNPLSKKTTKDVRVSLCNYVNIEYFDSLNALKVTKETIIFKI